MLFMHNQRVWGHEKLQLVISLIGIVAGRYLYDRVYAVQTQLSVVTGMVTATILLLYAVIWILLQKLVENRLNGNK